MTWPFQPNVQPNSGSSNSGPVFGQKPPSYITGRRYRPTLTIGNNAALTTTATRLYYIPIFIWEARSFQGASTRNSGAGDNGETLRLGLYTHSATNGPTTLVRDFGEITLTAAAAERVLTATASITSPDWYWMAIHTNTAMALYGAVAPGYPITSVGFNPTYDPVTVFFGDFSGTTSSLYTGDWSGCYVDTAYGALASTAVAPTTNVAITPMVWLIP